MNVGGNSIQTAMQPPSPTYHSNTLYTHKLSYGIILLHNNAMVKSTTHNLHKSEFNYAVPKP